jgi:hypothetical protein
VRANQEREAVEHVACQARPGLRCHDLRHSYAAWLAEDGVPINCAQQVIGHEKASRLLDIYTHTTKNRARANRRIREALASDPLPADDDADCGGRPAPGLTGRFGWWAQRDSNPRHLPCKGSALAN